MTLTRANLITDDREATRAEADHSQGLGDSRPEAQGRDGRPAEARSAGQEALTALAPSSKTGGSNEATRSPRPPGRARAGRATLLSRALRLAGRWPSCRISPRREEAERTGSAGHRGRQRRASLSSFLQK